jgi:hypothetical protein
VRFISNSAELSRRSILAKGYVKVFSLSIILLIFGIIMMAVTNLVMVLTQFGSHEIEYKTIYTLLIVSKLFIQIGMVLFSLSMFVGAVSDRGPSGEVKRGFAIASSISILALILSMIFPSIGFL